MNDDNLHRPSFLGRNKEEALNEPLICTKCGEEVGMNGLLDPDGAWHIKCARTTVTQPVMDALDGARAAGLPLFDIPRVMVWADNNMRSELYNLLLHNRRAYTRGLMAGFDVGPEEAIDG